VISFRLPPGIAAADLPPPFAEEAKRGEVIVSHASTDPLPELRALIDWAESRGASLPSLEVRRPSLEDVFLRVTGEAERDGGEEGGSGA
jgi:ABC-2 type transport system ATP-binding protein